MTSSTPSTECLDTNSTMDEKRDLASSTKQLSSHDDLERSSAGPDVAPMDKPKSNWNKPFRFYMAYLCLLLMVFMVSIDATALGVAIPVSFLIGFAATSKIDSPRRS